MAKDKKLPAIARMRVIAWTHALLNASGQTIKQLSTANFGDDRDHPLNPQFLLYARGGRTPSADTLKAIEEKYPDYDLQATFDIGPDFVPLWAILADDCPEMVLMDFVDLWLFPIKLDGQSPIADSLMLAMPFSKKVEAAFVRLAGKQAVDFERYTTGADPNAVSHPFMESFRMGADLLQLKKEGQPPSRAQVDFVEKMLKANMFAVDDFCAVIALRKISEARRECRSEIRYLFDGMLELAPYGLVEFGLGRELAKFMKRWQAPCSPRTIAIHDTILRLNKMKERTWTTPADSCIVARALDKHLAKTSIASGN